jgi:hypothetical protein
VTHAQKLIIKKSQVKSAAPTRAAVTVRCNAAEDLQLKQATKLLVQLLARTQLQKLV